MNTVFRAMKSAPIALLLTGCIQYPETGAGEEYISPHEQQDIAGIIDLLTGELEKQYPESPVLRDTHPKSNGCVHGTFKALENIPPEYQHGVFSSNAEYPVWVRFSNAAEEVTSDRNKDFRGFGLKLFGVEGERLPVPGDEQHTQDFLFLGHDAFFAQDAFQFLEFFEANFEGRRNWYLITHPLSLWNIWQGAQNFGNQLDMDWFGVTPYQLGEMTPSGNAELAVKYKLEACNPTGRTYDADRDGDDYFREVMEAQLKNGEGCFRFMIQKQNDPAEQPIEDARIAWDEEDSPFTEVARITIPSQGLGTPEQLRFCENLSFNPWHGIQAHRPLGSVNRARRDVMKAISDFRLSRNGQQRIEPTGTERFADLSDQLP